MIRLNFTLQEENRNLTKDNSIIFNYENSLPESVATHSLMQKNEGTLQASRCSRLIYWVLGRLQIAVKHNQICLLSP